VKLAIVAAIAATAGLSASAATPITPAGTADQVSPIFGVAIPFEYRRWELIAVSQEVGLGELRASWEIPSR